MTTKRSTRTPIIIMSLLVLLFGLCFFLGCQENEETEIGDCITVTFRARGEEDIVVTAKSGGSITPPEVPKKTGNSGYWDTDDFTELTADFFVNAVYETEGLKYTLIDSGYEVDKGEMDPETTELYIPTEYNGLPVTNIGSRAFDGCAKLVYVSLPKNLTTICERGFYFCLRLKSVELPMTIAEIGEAAFWGCRFRSIDIPTGLKCIKDYTFCGTAIEDIVIPKGVTSIGANAFASCSNMKSVTLPESLKSIGKEAFVCCWVLDSITVPNGVTEIGDGAFSYCISLRTAKLPEGLKNIPNMLFYACSKFRIITLPDGLESIGYNAFDRTKMKWIIIPETVVKIGLSVFESWTKDQTIYVKGYTQKPDGWVNGWSSNATVVWGC